LLKNFIFDSTVDVFFIHPTTFTDRKDERWNADMDDAALNAKLILPPSCSRLQLFNEARVFPVTGRQT
jgi:hypothetical protein